MNNNFIGNTPFEVDLRERYGYMSTLGHGLSYSDKIPQEDKAIFYKKILRYFINQIQKVAMLEHIIKDNMTIPKEAQSANDIIDDIITLMNSWRFNEMNQLLSGDVTLGEKIGFFNFNAEDNIHWVYNPSIMAAYIYISYVVLSDEKKTLIYIYNKYFSSWSIRYIFLRILAIYGSLDTIVDVLKGIDNPRLFKLSKRDIENIENGKVVFFFNTLYSHYGTDVMDKHVIDILGHKIINDNNISTQNDLFVSKAFLKHKKCRLSYEKLSPWLVKQGFLPLVSGLHDFKCLKILLKSNLKKEEVDQLLNRDSITVDISSLLSSLWNDGHHTQVNPYVLDIIFDRVKYGIYQKDETSVNTYFKDKIIDTESGHDVNTIVIGRDHIIFYGNIDKNDQDNVITHRKKYFDYLHCMIQYIFNGDNKKMLNIYEYLDNYSININYNIMHLLSAKENISMLYNFDIETWRIINSSLGRYDMLTTSLYYRLFYPFKKKPHSQIDYQELIEFIDENAYLLRFIQHENIQLKFLYDIEEDSSKCTRMLYLIYLISDILPYGGQYSLTRRKNHRIKTYLDDFYYSHKRHKRIEDVKEYDIPVKQLLKDILEKKIITNPYLNPITAEMLLQEQYMNNVIVEHFWVKLFENMDYECNMRKYFKIIRDMTYRGSIGNSKRIWRLVVDTNSEKVFDFFLKHIPYNDHIMTYCSTRAIAEGKLAILRHMHKCGKRIHITTRSINNALKKNHIRTIDFLYDIDRDGLCSAIKSTRIHLSLLQNNQEDNENIQISIYLKKWLQVSINKTLFPRGRMFEQLFSQ